jgi:hypothetical protein
VQQIFHLAVAVATGKSFNARQPQNLCLSPCSYIAITSQIGSKLAEDKRNIEEIFCVTSYDKKKLLQVHLSDILWRSLCEAG